ncbi:MAG TPA: YicC/YloC family endoribonuclease [Nitrospirales bacterium]|nr:YicC/YloC family endoribonuclease [Nitrospirales bacterium]
MIRSMTGYGRAEGRHKGTPIVVEVRSVNHRHCEVVSRLPRALQAYDERVRGVVQAHLSRGRVDVTITFSGERDPGRGLMLDLTLARRYLALLTDLRRKLKLAGSPDVALVAGFPNVIKPAELAVEDRGAVRAVEQVLTRALKAVAGMRVHEGRALERDLSARVDEIERHLAAIRRRLPDIVQEYAARLRGRVTRLLEGMGEGKDRIDPSRLAQEMALLADRSDVSEELTRLDSHLEQFRGFLRKSEPVGRSLDFLLQEINREITTIGSKVGDVAVTQEIVAVKAELEKVREQVQNVE